MGVSQDAGARRTGRMAPLIATSNDKALHDVSPIEDRDPLASCRHSVLLGLFIASQFPTQQYFRPLRLLNCSFSFNLILLWSWNS